jgi:hypothetical protein
MAGRWGSAHVEVDRRTLLRLAALGAVGATVAARPSPASADTFVLGATKPDASNTGVPSGTALTVLNGDLKMVAGRTYQNLDIRGFVIGAARATLVNSRVRGRGTGYIKPGLVNGTATTTGMHLVRCTLVPDFPRFYLNGFDGSNCLLERCDMSAICDGAYVHGDNVQVHGCYLHDFAFFDGSTGTDHANDPAHPGWNHNDGVESLGGSGLEVIGNSIQCYNSRTVGTPQTALQGGYPNANHVNGVTLAPKHGRIPGFRVTDNWLEGGDILLQIPAKGTGFDTGNDGNIARNRCGADQKPLGSGWYVQMGTARGMGTFTGLGTNTFDNLPSVPAALRGQPLVRKTGSYFGTDGFSYAIKK